MREIEYEISKEEYDKISNMKYSDRKDYIMSCIPAQWIYGYGYYGHRLNKSNNKFYIIHKIGANCD